MVCHVQVNGAVGCLARIPLPSRAFCAPHIPLPWLSHKQADGDEGASDADPGAAADPSLAHGRFARELWEPYLQDTSLRVFASCGLSGQVCFGCPFLPGELCEHADRQIPRCPKLFKCCVIICAGLECVAW